MIACNMPKVRTWFPDEAVTLRNSWARLYFDPGRTRLMLEDGWFDFSNLRDRAYAMAWCKTNGVEFFDHRPELSPDNLRGLLRRARAAGSGELRQLKSRWRLVPLPGAQMFIPQVSHCPTWRQSRQAHRPPKESSLDVRPRYWNGTKFHAHSCPCAVCDKARAEGRTSTVES